MVSYVGYRREEVIITGTNQAITLQLMDASLGEVVVIGYGTQRKASVSGAVDQIRAAALEGSPALTSRNPCKGYRPT
ncbi:hypothetical protein [Paraflavitalea speifideaquila]|uniref:hypothetical protein n=1 Tax=Paraflavitalea speifideaquila TaxID=3076558 RepID=UPI0028E36B93|nr:hypothetical protein [Paraflavitalea speifideiaquila]